MPAHVDVVTQLHQALGVLRQAMSVLPRPKTVMTVTPFWRPSPPAGQARDPRPRLGRDGFNPDIDDPASEKS